MGDKCTCVASDNRPGTFSWRCFKTMSGHIGKFICSKLLNLIFRRKMKNDDSMSSRVRAYFYAKMGSADWIVSVITFPYLIYAALVSQTLAISWPLGSIYELLTLANKLVLSTPLFSLSLSLSLSLSPFHPPVLGNLVRSHPDRLSVVKLFSTPLSSSIIVNYIERKPHTFRYSHTGTYAQFAQANMHNNRTNACEHSVAAALRLAKQITIGPHCSVMRCNICVCVCVCVDMVSPSLNK